jgi:Transglutaminase-like superfamily
VTRARLAVEVVVAYVRVRRAARSPDIRTTLGALRSQPRRRPPAEAPERLARATARALGPLPGDTRCLMQSLTLTTLLARRGVESKLVIGVRPGEAFGAHAWVELEGRPLLASGGHEFARLVEL